MGHIYTSKIIFSYSPVFLLFATIILILLIEPSSARLRIPKDSQQLQEALDSAQQGDTIELLPIDYIGDFVISKSSIERAPIKLIGHFMPSSSSQNENNTASTNSTNIIAADQTALTILGDYWIIKNLNITGGDEEGIVLQYGGHHRLESLAIHDTKTAIILDESDHNLLGSISISDCHNGIIVYNGSSNYFRDIAWSNVSNGIHLHIGDSNRLHNLVVHDNNPAAGGVNTSLHLGRSTCCGVLTNTIFSGLVEIAGNGYNLRQTIVYGAVNVLGCNNSFTRSIFNNVYFNEECENKQLSQNIYHLTSQRPIKEP